MLQITGVDGVSQNTIVLLLPPGYSARPLKGSDLALLQVMNSGDHVVALGGALAGHVIADLDLGEFGLTDGTQMVVFRTDHLELTSPTKIRCVTPRFEVTGEVVSHCDTGSVGLGTHKHAETGSRPEPPRPAGAG